jgi:hypothetical protein
MHIYGVYFLYLYAIFEHIKYGMNNMALWHDALNDEETSIFLKSEAQLKSTANTHKALKMKFKSRAESRIRQRSNKANERCKIIEYAKLLEK